MKSRFDHRQTVPLQPSWQTRALNALLRLTMRRRIKSDSDVVALRQSYEQIDARYFRVAADVTRTPATCGGVPAEWIAVPESRADRVILYLHGGSFAFRFPNAHAALAARLCRRLRARALIPDYRLTPEHPFPAARDDCHRAYRGLLAEGDAIDVADLPPEIVEKTGRVSVSIPSSAPSIAAPSPAPPPDPDDDSEEGPDLVRVRAALEEAKWRREKAAEILGVSPRTLYRWIKKLGL